MSNTNEFTITMVVEKTPDGDIKSVEKSNWSGICIVCSRKAYATAKQRYEELTFPGVYLLWGKDEENSELDLFYVGLTENIGKRMKSHEAKKGFFRRVVVFTTLSKTTPLNTAMGKYLESRLLKKAVEVGRCKINNETGSNESSLNRGDKVFCDGYFEEMMLLLPNIGIDAFKLPEVYVAAPVTAQKAESVNVKVYSFIEGKIRGEARGHETAEGFVVLEGSHAKKNEANLTEKRQGIRKHLKEQKILTGDGAFYRFTKSHEFDSPTQAAAIVAGSHVGNVWKTEKGKP